MRAKFSYVGHRGGLNLQLTPLQNLRWSAAIEGSDASNESLSSLLDGIGLAGYELTPCQQLSAGQQRRAALARLGFGNAALWLLDEPLTALDDAGCALVRDSARAASRPRRRGVVRHAPVIGSRSDAAACTRTCRVTAVAFARAPSVGRAFTAQLQRDLTIAFRSRSELINPLMFYVMGISMFPLGVGPGAERLAEIAPGVLWVLALLSTLLSLDSLFRRDFDDGTLEQLVLNVDPLFVGVLAKVLAHWLVIGLPLTLLSPVAALMMFLPAAAVPTLVLTLLLGTPILSLLGAVGAALTVGLKRGGLLLTLIILPLYVPVLILGAGAVTAVIDGVDAAAQLAWLAAILALTLTLTPFAVALALRVGLE